MYVYGFQEMKLLFVEIGNRVHAVGIDEASIAEDFWSTDDSGQGIDL